MFYPSNTVESLFRCEYCKQRFTDVVKLINECGNSICGKCYDDLRDTMKQTDQYRCKACNQTHIMPKCGLGDVKTIMKMLNLKPEVKALSDEALELKKLIEETQNRIERLKNYDERTEINQYCDLLQNEVKNAIENCTKILNKLEETYNKEIEIYREKLLSQKVDKKPAKRFKANSANLGNEQLVISNSSAALIGNKELEDLSIELGEFSAKWFDYFAHINKAASTREIERAQEQAKDYSTRAKQIEVKKITAALSGNYLRFREDGILKRNTNIIGRLVYENSYSGNTIKGL